MTEVEVTTAKAALAALPESWVSPEFSATILDRASLQAVHRMVSTRTSAATAAVAAATAALAQDPSDATISNLVAAQATLTALSDVRAVLPPITIDASACTQAVAVAGHAMASAVPPAPVPLDYLDELARWRNFSRSSGATVDAPIATDADRAAQGPQEDSDAQVKQWQSGASMVRSLDINTSDPLGILGSAASYIDRAAAVAKAVEAANKVTSQANAARAAAHLNWSAS